MDYFKGMYKKLLLLILGVSQWLMASAQTPMNLDSLLKQLAYAKEDSAAVDLYIYLGQQYEADKPETAKYYYRMAGDLSKKINYPAGIIKFINNYTYVLNFEGKADSSLPLMLQGVDLCRKTGDSINLAKCLFNTGNVYRAKSDYNAALPYYLEGSMVFEKIGRQEYAAQSLDILQVVYNEMGLYEKALVYGKQAVLKSRESNNPRFLGTALLNLGSTYLKLNQPREGLALLNEALTIGKKINHKQIQSSSLLSIGQAYILNHEYSRLKPIYSQALEIAKEMEDREAEITALNGLAIYSISIQDYPSASQYGLNALAIADKFNFSLQKIQVLGTLSNLSYAKQDMKTAEAYAREAILLKDSLMNDKMRQAALELEKKYETAKKENQIQKLEADKKLQDLELQRKNVLNIILILGALALSVIFLLSWRNYKHRQDIQQQRITELETEKQLAATEAVLKGEAQERTRLAKDLHDGLGGMLSGIKYSMNTMKGNLIMTPENQQAFERSMDMLDSSIREMRRVAHNLMPESLVKFGLDTALKDFCNDIQQSGALNVTYQSVGLEGVQMDQTQAITIFRIVQELLNNIMKHAGAGNAIVQLTKTEGLFAVTVEDDGKGFDPILLKGTKGIGWSNIQNRVEFMKGRVDVQSENNQGTSVHIELPLT
jgi:two-component system, NarL family, sensor kinase